MSPRTSQSADRAPLPLRLIGALVGLAFAFPAAYLIWRNITAGADPAELLVSRRTLAPLGRTLRLAATVASATAVLGTSLAWLTARTDLPLRRFWQVVLPIPLVFPTFIGAAAFIRTLNPGGLANDLLEGLGIEQTLEMRGFTGAWLVLTLFTYPYVYLPTAARLRRLAGSLEENARLLGDTPIQVFRRIVLPQIAPSVGAGTLLVLLYTISDFGAVQLMRYDTLTRAIATNQLAAPEVALALGLILLGVATIAVAGERLLSNLLRHSEPLATSRPVQYRLGRWKALALGWVALVAVAATGAPSAALIDWATQGVSRTFGGGRSLTIDLGEVTEATWNTLQVSLLSAGVAVAAVIPIALLVGRYRDRSGSLAYAVVIATFALPGILIALALRFWTLQSDLAFEFLGDTMALLIFAYVVRFGSLAMGVTLLAVRSVPDRLHDAARTMGAGAWRRFRTIDLPLMLPGLGAAAGLVLLSTMKELPISLFVSPIGFSTLATRIFGSFEEAFVVEAGIMALVLVILSALFSWFLVLRQPDRL